MIENYQHQEQSDDSWGSNSMVASLEKESENLTMAVGDRSENLGKFPTYIFD